MLDLFSGIGGFALAASWVWAGDLELQGFCEIDSYCQKVLKKNFPDVPIYEDITELQPEWFDDIDLLTGGFPCQDISVAGKGEGLEGDRSGLWFEMLRLISGIRPRYALIENVPMLLHRGLGRVVCDLAGIGYDAEWQIISAADLGAPHLRKRIWIAAYPISINGGNPHRSEPSDSLEGKGPGEPDRARGGSRTMAYATRVGQSGSGQPIDSRYQAQGREGQATESIDECIGDIWSTEPDLGRVADGVPKRVDRLRGLGNAIVPQVAALIMERIKAAG